MKKIFRFTRKKGPLLFLSGFFIAVLLFFSGNKLVKLTGSDEYCASCHVHPHSTTTWKMSTHYDNKRGVVIHCIECHLPPEGLYKYTEKIRTGARDIYGTLFKDTDEINWDEKSTLAAAIHHTYEISCTACHENLFPLGLTREGEDAHLYYNDNAEDLHCINCHLGVGHYSETNLHAKNVEFGNQEKASDTIYDAAAEITAFENFTETLPGTGIGFKMVAIPSGSFKMGSESGERYRDTDEGPPLQVEISRFFMAETEVSWDQYMAFFSETGGEGRMSESEMEELNVDGITGPTPPWGDPSQGWGRGKRPAMTMSHYAAEVYCEWLSHKTGKKYRLPTEAEWEYAARAGTEGAYFFEGSPSDYTSKTFWNRTFGTDTTIINKYAIYRENSRGRTYPPDRVKANPFGLKNMLGNVAEFCGDFYSARIYEEYAEGIKDPEGPETGDEYVIRGGSFRADAADLRIANREHTRTADWLKTDPQMPKSIWWYSDAVHVGFRVVCEFDEN